MNPPVKLSATIEHENIRVYDTRLPYVTWLERVLAAREAQNLKNSANAEIGRWQWAAGLQAEPVVR